MITITEREYTEEERENLKIAIEHEDKQDSIIKPENELLKYYYIFVIFILWLFLPLGFSLPKSSLGLISGAIITFFLSTRLLIFIIQARVNKKDQQERIASLQELLDNPRIEVTRVENIVDVWEIIADSFYQYDFLFRTKENEFCYLVTSHISRDGINANYEEIVFEKRALTGTYYHFQFKGNNIPYTGKIPLQSLLNALNLENKEELFSEILTRIPDDRIESLQNFLRTNAG